MASTFESLVTIIFFTLLVQGHGQCQLKDLTVLTSKTPRQIQDVQEWQVMFVNNCKCNLKDIIVSCKGFQSLEDVDPNVFAPIGNDKFIVNGGLPIEPFASVMFLYADPQHFVFEPVSHDMVCVST
ncbi:unnamed protein product [Lactuca saligna]|uniref:Uncharacterized protein n=1 Tax=Lactuca saligna TaxID=75948 RepID=A0AA35YB13_LACSI|nr:unnamed protein product [Lactuca saligna]